MTNKQKENVERIFKEAENGDAESMACLGLNYHSGEVLEQDDEKATYWLTKAAETGYIFAQMKLGLWYYRGFSVKEDIDKAIEWLEKVAAQTGDVDTRSMIGMARSNLYTVKREKLRRGLLKQAETDLDPKLQNKIGVMYFEDAYGCEERDSFNVRTKVPNVDEDFHVSIDIDEDAYNEAVRWFTKAAEQGYKAAMYNLSECYFNGYYLGYYSDKNAEFVQDDEKGRFWRKKSGIKD